MTPTCCIDPTKLFLKVMGKIGSWQIKGLQANFKMACRDRGVPRSAGTAEAGVYQASSIKRHRSTKAEVGERRQTRLHHDPRDD
jgi:hypothetical protein